MVVRTSAFTVAAAVALIGIFSTTVRASPADSRDFLDHSPRAGEYAALGAVAGGLALALGATSASETANWRGGIFFDDSMRNTLRLGTESGRKAAGRASDVLQLS